MVYTIWTILSFAINCQKYPKLPIIKIETNEEL